MAREQRDNSGVLWQNHNRTSEKHPTMKGDCQIAGVQYWVSAWTKDGKGGTFLTLSFQPKEQKHVQEKIEQSKGDCPF